MSDSQLLFQTLPGDESFKGLLRRALQKGSLGRSLLFCGPKSSGKEQYAKEIALFWLDPERFQTRAHHPDLKIYAPEGKLGLHSIESMRKFSEEVYLSPYEAKGKVFILLAAERMLPTSANALLKTFEEPSSDTLIILTTEKQEALLPTVLSRCQKLIFKGEATGNSDDLQDPRIQKMFAFYEDPTRACFKDLKALSFEIGKHLESLRDEKEKAILQELKGSLVDKPTAVQEALYLKEAEGAAAEALQDAAGHYFEAILKRARDMQVIFCGGPSELLFYPALEQRYIDGIQKALFIAPERLEKAVVEAKLSLSRSTAPVQCFENLFLKTLI